MSIWFKETAPELIDSQSHKGLTKTLEIRVTELADNSLSGKMPVTDKHLQPFGILHGGATIALGETLASLASWLTLDPDKQYCVGQHVEANHLRPVSTGWVTGTATIRHKGRRQQLWDVEIRDDQQRLVSLQRVGMAILDISKEKIGT